MCTNNVYQKNCIYNDLSSLGINLYSNWNIAKLPIDNSSINDDENNSIIDNYNNPVSDDFNVVAHRGYSEIAPENTIPAFIAAAENGFTSVECDIEWTKDNVPVILHDSTINRTARKKNGWIFFFKHKCSDYTFDELLEFDFGRWKGKEFKGTKIPSFTQLLDCCDEYNLNLYVEIKETDNFDKEKAQILAEEVRKAGLEDKVTWISFNADYLKMMSKIMPDSRLGYLSKETPNEDTIEILDELKTRRNEVFLDVKASKMTEKASDKLDDAGYDFEAWTVDNSDVLEQMYDYDCTGITTNSLTEDTVERIIDLSD